MFRCSLCGIVFPEPDVRRWNEYHGPEIGYEPWAVEVCPFCGDEDIEEWDEDDYE